MNPSFFQRRTPVGVVVLTLLALASGVVSYFGIQGGSNSAATIPADNDASRLDYSGPVVSIEMPHYDADLPSAPNREAVQVSCTICHSPQLILDQPHFSRKQWEETVHKMVKNYGAPVSPAQQIEVLDYLMEIRGAE